MMYSKYHKTDKSGFWERATLAHILALLEAHIRAPSVIRAVVKVVESIS